jgi:deazaflavin-dependent oxidoreductase (nitroreductase family)
VTVGDAESADTRRKRRRTVRLQRYVLNPPMKAAVWLGLVPGHLIVETTGRTTGRRRRTVVGCRVDDGTVWVVAEQGRRAGYVRNLEADPHCRLRLSRRWRPAVAALLDDDDPQARLEAFDPKHAALVRKAGTSLLTLRFERSGG